MHHNLAKHQNNKTMKSLNSRLCAVVIAIVFSTVQLTSCKSNQTDSEIQQAVNEKLAKNEESKGLNATVKNGVVTLTGECPTEECRKDCFDAVKNVNGVKDVENNIRVASISDAPAPVEVSSDATLTTSVNDIVKKYDGVNAEVKDGVITLRGEIKRDNLQPLIISLNELKPKKVDNQLAIK